MYDMSALYQAQSVQDAIRLRLEHPEAQIIAVVFPSCAAKSAI